MNAKSISLELDTLHVHPRSRSKWFHGVLLYADELLDNVWNSDEITEARLLNGARDWKAYSEGGCSLVTDEAVCRRLCAPWEVRKTKGGTLPPNNRETWMEVQARALYQAARLVLELANAI